MGRDVICLIFIVLYFFRINYTALFICLLLESYKNFRTFAASNRVL